MIGFVKVKDPSSIDAVSDLAHEIWNQHFVPIIGQAQVDYMLDRFQSADAIAKQLREGYDYYIITNNEKSVGYLGLLPEKRHSRMMISKIYVQKQARGFGVGDKAIAFAVERSKKHRMNTIWLTVNKQNKGAIEWYLKRGFVVTEEVKKDIGNGFFMDDYVMKLKIN